MAYEVKKEFSAPIAFTVSFPVEDMIEIDESQSIIAKSNAVFNIVMDKETYYNITESEEFSGEKIALGTLTITMFFDAEHSTTLEPITIYIGDGGIN